MDPISLACAMAMLPGARSADMSFTRGFLTMDAPGGVNRPAAQGDLLTVNFAVRTLANESIADSDKRGMTYSFKIGEAGNDPMLEKVAIGMRDRATRVAVLTTEQGYGPAIPTFLKKGQTLIVSVTILRRG